MRPLTVDERIVLGSVGEDRSNAPGRRRDLRSPVNRAEPDDPIHRFLAGKASRTEWRNLVRLLLRLHARPDAPRLTEEQEPDLPSSIEERG